MSQDHRRDEFDVTVTDADMDEARREAGNVARNATLGGVALVALTFAVTVFLLQLLAPTLDGLGLVAVGTGLAAAISGPPLALLATGAQRKGLRTLGSVRVARERHMRAMARRREFEGCLVKGLEMAEEEPDALEVTERALQQVSPIPAELLLADNSHAHLVRMAVSAPGGEAPGCPVDSPHACVAARHARTVVFADSEQLDACPKLRGRPAGPRAAVCLPVSIMGRAVGVLHVAGAPDELPDEETVSQLEVLANQVGNRLGMLRVMAETQLQASTDGLTGLMNRRTFENKIRTLRRQAKPFVLALADLDHFKQVNDTHGHEAGDRALRLFAHTLRTALRPDDIVCRLGGEEFVAVLPNCSVHDAVEAMDRVRTELAAALVGGSAPTFTASFGVADGGSDGNLEEVLARADQALYRAKSAGRDRVAVADDELGVRSVPDGRAGSAPAVGDGSAPLSLPASRPA
jgi:diguanylate cyclase (GGDEF)-like protein